MMQYDDFRSKMSKHSARHRVKRNQQLLEAQRLLESHNMEAHARNEELRGDVIFDEKEKFGSTIIDNGSNQIGDDKCFQTKRSNINLLSNLGMHLEGGSRNGGDNQPVNKREKHFQRNQPKSLDGKWQNIPDKDKKYRVTPECGKIDQLKQRMEKRRQKRRQMMMTGVTYRNESKDLILSNQDISSKERTNENGMGKASCHEEVVRYQQKMTQNSRVDKKHKHMSNMQSHRIDFNDTSSSECSKDGASSIELQQNFEGLSCKGDDSKDEEDNDDRSVVSIELIYCQYCKKSYAPETSKRFCQTLDENGDPKCLRLGAKKRKAYNSAKMRILNNSHLQPDEQRIVISGRKKVVAALRQKAKGNISTKRDDKWRQQSEEFREAMKSNRLIVKAQKEGKPAHYYL